MNKKVIVATLFASILTAQLHAFAQFTDLGDTRLAWAKVPIEEMTKMNIIKGYEDNTFRPDNAVSKAESLVLMSRISGFTEASSAEYIDQAKSVFADTLKGYSTSYKDEISYLLYRGVLTPADISVYVADSTASSPLKRYEAAILLTKLMGEDASVSATKDAKLDFDDAGDVPAAARPYVAFVNQNGIMQGMGENKFEPMYDVSRAQMATLLYRVLTALDFTYETGSLSLYTAETNTLKMVKTDGTTKTYTVRTSVPSKLDGLETDLTNFAVGSPIRLTFSNDKIIFVDGIAPSIEETIEGIYDGFESMTDGIVITVKDSKTAEKKKFTLASAPTIVRNGSAAAVTDLKQDDFLTLDILDGKVIYAKAENKTKEVTGKIKSIILEPKFSLVVEIAGSEISYDVYDTISVKRNGKTSSLSDVMAGDTVTLTLNYNIISNISATSSVSVKQGYLQEIRISNTPSVVVKNDGGTITEYAVLRNVEIVRNGSSADLYSLRVGDSVSITVEGSTVTKIELSSAAASASITGKVEYVNTAYGYVKLYDIPDLIFMSKAKVQDNSGKSLTLKDVKAEVSVTIFGTQKPGSYEATLIVIN